MTFLYQPTYINFREKLSKCDRKDAYISDDVNLAYKRNGLIHAYICTYIHPWAPQ